jgi:hypothetical protein
MTDPRDLSVDQRELLDVLEQLSRLPIPISTDDFQPLSDRALDLIEERTGVSPLTIGILSHYRRKLRDDGHELASAGVALLVLRWFAEVEIKASTAPLN